MNNKKNKSKGRGKTTKKVQETENVIEKLEDSEILISESLNTDETRVPDIEAESITITENDQLIDVLPEKPKRCKNKKKKEQVFENIEDKAETPENTKDVQEISANTQNITQDTIEIAPSVRKKKKKAKKLEEKSDNVNLIVAETTEREPDKEIGLKLDVNENVTVDDLVLSQNIEVRQKDDAPCKKKKKKKRHDSEKSDKCDPCTLAFQKLIETPREDDKSNDHVEEQLKQNDTITEDIIVLQGVPADKQNKEIKPEEIKSKKKNKKGKKNPPEEHVCSDTIDEQSMSERNIQNISEDHNILPENLDHENVNKVTSSKPKAKIAKPVQKKQQNRSESESQKPLLGLNLEMNIHDNSSNDFSKTDNIKENPEKNLYHTDDNIKETITISSEPEMSNSSNIIQDNVINQGQSIKQVLNESKESSDSINNSSNEEKVENSPKNYDDSGFVKVRTVKGKKKANKTTLTPDTAETIKIKSNEIEKDLNITCMEQKLKIQTEQKDIPKTIMPDLIEYPRSTSQQNVDRNNNTFIQEITPTEDIKLSNPLYTPTPIIQGSGESPEAKTRNEPVIIKVSEIVSQPLIISKDEIKEKNQASEKTDIKSKMIEVNRDMEELRRSIERSLAELTAIDKSDTEVEKEFEELFQSQTADQLSIEIRKSKIAEPDISIDIDVNSKEKENTNEDSKTPIETKQDGKIEVDDKETKNISMVSDDKMSDVGTQNAPPVCPARRDKTKTKSKKKGKKEMTTHTNPPMDSGSQNTSADTVTSQKSAKSEQKSEKSEKTQEKGKQQSLGGEKDSKASQNCESSLEPIEKFEDALTSSNDDINQSFEIIAKDAIQPIVSSQYHNNPKINIISPAEEIEEEKHVDNNERKNLQHPISHPKNLLGHPNIPASSNDKGLKREKCNPPNTIQAKVKIKDSVEIEKATNKKSQIEYNKESNGVDLTYNMKTNEDLIYKYSFRKVFLQNTCHVCKKELVQRVPCTFCSLVFYCSQKHKDEDWSHHQSLCFAVSTIAHLKEQKHIYADSQNILDHDYRVLRMQTILSCEKILNRRLMPWEQEALLYPRICADVTCRQWKQGQLKDCENCGQISYCIDYPEHLPSSHQRWCKSYSLYQKLVNYQLTKGRLEPPLPTRVLNHYKIPAKINDVLGSMYKEKIDMDDIQYAALTQIATAPLTAAYSYQLFSTKMNSSCANGVKKNSTFTIHLVGIELPFEADSLNKWEKFFLHLRSDVQDLRVVMIGPDINSTKLPLDLLRKVKLCDNCHTNKRRVLFDFHENESYHDYYMSDGFVTPDIVCAFNPNIHRSCANEINSWPSTINCILKQRVPFVVTSFSIEELRRDLGKVRECTKVDFNVVSEIKYNPFGSVRPDRNFITDHEIPLLFKNYCFCILCGTL